MKCRHCESEKVISQGSKIKCKNCDRVSSKIQRRHAPPLNERPLCPDCGSPEPYAMGSSKGIRLWSCRSCGRFYKDRSQEVKVEIPILEVQVE